jgi:WD40 repeat protein
MRRFLRDWRRLLLGLFLLGLGYVLYQRLPPVERWSVRLDEDATTAIFSFSPDGRFLFSHHRELTKGGVVFHAYEWAGPFRKRGTATGLILAEGSEKGRVYESHSTCPPSSLHMPFPKFLGRFWAGLPKGENAILELFDLESGKERRIPIARFSKKWKERDIVLSPAENVAALFHVKDPLKPGAQIILYAVPSGEQLAVFSSDGGGSFSPDGSYFVYSAKGPAGPCLRIWDTNKHQERGALPRDGDLVGSHRFSPNGRFLLAWDLKKETVHPVTTKVWDLLDPGNPRLVADLPVPDDFLYFTPDSKTLIQFHTENSKDIVFWEMTTGLEKGRMLAPFKSFAFVAFSPDNRLMAFNTGVFAKDGVLAVTDLASREVLWSKPVPVSSGSNPFFIIPGETETLVLITSPSGSYQGEFRSARTGELLGVFAMGFRDVQGPLLSSNERYVLYYGHGKWPPDQTQGWLWETLRKWLPSNRDSASDLIRVIDVPTLCEVFHLADSHVENAQLSPDGGTLITVHPKDPDGPHLRCWDIPARHPWLKIVGIPAAIGLVLLLLGKWRQIRKARKAAVKAAS